MLNVHNYSSLIFTIAVFYCMTISAGIYPFTTDEHFSISGFAIPNNASMNTFFMSLGEHLKDFSRVFHLFEYSHKKTPIYSI